MSLANRPSLDETGRIDPVPNPSPLTLAKNGSDGENENVNATTPGITKKKPSDVKRRKFPEDGIESRKAL